ncbi:MAG: nitrate/nitrite transporter NrtS [Mycobacteriales bacterium]
MGESPQWSTAREALSVMARPRHLRRTVVTALVVGTVLFVINQLDVVLAGRASWATWVKGVVTYLVPFGVANVGILIATRKPSET